MFKINDIDLKDFKIEVLESGGLYDFPSRAGKINHDWHESDGVQPYVNESEIYYKQRTISLKCLLESTDINDFTYQLGRLKDLLYDGWVRLETAYSLTFNVLLKDQAAVKYNYESSSAIFTLNFKEIVYDPSTLPVPTPQSTVINDVYSIDKVLFSQLGLIVETSSGNFDFTSMKSDRLTIYKNESFFNNARMSRNIKLQLSLIGTDVADFNNKIHKLHYLLNNEGLRSLIIPGSISPYEVYCKDGFRVKELYRHANQIIAKFELTLFEPDPQVEKFSLCYLKDTDDNFILTTDGYKIIVICYRDSIKTNQVYLFTKDENEDKTYIFSKNELADPEFEDIYLFKNDEII